MLTPVNAPILSEAFTLTQHGRQVTIVALSHETPPLDVQEYGAIHFRWVQLCSRRLPKNGFFWAIKYVEAVVRMIVLGMRQQADVYEAHDLDALVPAFVMSRLRKKHLVYNAHELWTERPHIPAKSLWKWVERRLIPAASSTICPDEGRADIIFREYGAPTRPIVIANCPNYKTVERTSRLADYLRHLGVEDVRIVLYQGGLSASRCCEEMVTAFTHVSTKSVLVLMGSGEQSYIEHLRSTISQQKLDEKVFLHPAVPLTDVMTYTASADIGIALYRNSGRNNYHCAPTKLGEYFLARLPVIASDFPGMRNLVEKNGLGLLVDPESPTQIGHAIDRLAGDPGLYRRMSQQAWDFARTTYNWQMESVKLINLYDGLLA